MTTQSVKDCEEMAVVYAKDRYPWRSSEVVSAVMLLLLTAGIVVLGIVAEAPPLTYVGGGIALFLALFYIIANFRVKYRRTLNVELNEDNTYANFWLTRENRALWGDKLKRDRNQGYLNTLRSVAYQQVGVYGVFAFALKDGKTLYLPERGMKPNVQAYLRKLVLETLHGRIGYADKKSQAEFERVVGLNGATPAEA